MNTSQIDVIVEARMCSTRLPGKVLLPAAGKPMLELMIERLMRIEPLSGVVVATTVHPDDDVIEALAERLGVGCFRGSENDVLGRVVAAAQRFGTDIIVEITGDDPLVDPRESSRVIQTYLDRREDADYVANDLEQTYPIGLNTRAFSRSLLEFVERSTDHPVNREHVVNYICKRPDEFRLLNVAAEAPYRRTDLRLTMDEPSDYDLIRAVFDALYPRDPAFTILDVYEFLDDHPEIRDANRSVVQRTYPTV